MSNSIEGLKITLDELSKLEEAAKKAKDTAYCPYSSFRVGCALLAADDNSTIITGANVENASYPVGTCAERCALAKGVTEGFLKYKAIAVATDVKPAGMRISHLAGSTHHSITLICRFRPFQVELGSLLIMDGMSNSASPCGMCRQFMREFCELDMPIIMLDKDGKRSVSTMEVLLPLSFGPENLLRTDLARAKREDKA